MNHLIELPRGDFAVESFFGITYEVDFVGAPGGMLDGFAGRTIGTVRLEIVQAWYLCYLPLAQNSGQKSSKRTSP